MHWTRWCYLLIFTLVFASWPALGKTPTSVKSSTIREENPKGKKETLIFPYVLSPETMGLTIGIGGMVKGYGQDQLKLGATFFASRDELEDKGDANGFIGGMWDLRIPYTKRFFFSAFATDAYYPRKRVYTAPAFPPDEIRPGSNESSADQFFEVGGDDLWFDLSLEYVLAIGSAKKHAMMTYKLKDGLLDSEPTGSSRWNPLLSGVTHLLLRQYNRYQAYEVDPENLSRTIHPAQLGISYDNTDFPINPSAGSRQFIGITQDFAMLESDQTWTFWEINASKFYSLGKSDWARQRVFALNFWTGDTPTYNEKTLENGSVVEQNAPPYYEGANLGGFDRMRAFPFYRFNDRSVIYSAAEYRYTLQSNPIAKIRWLRFLKLDWLQLAGFVEGGRVAREYKVAELTSDWKADIGAGIRAMVAGTTVRFDAAFSNEGSNFWFMVGQPF